ncbi:MAG: SbcC/MukB-like Walker B domain-containing protein, partial [Salinimicrobium sp.]
QLGMKAYFKKKEVSSEIEKEQQEIELHRKNLLEEEEHKRLSEELSEKSKTCAPLEKKIDSLKQNLQLKESIKTQLAQIESHRRKKTEADAALQKFETEHGQQLQKHEKIRLFGEELTSWKQLQSDCRELGTEIENNLKRSSANREEINTSLKEINAFTGAKAEAETVEQQLQEFSGKVSKLQQQREEKGTTYKALKREFETELREVPFQLNGNLESAGEKLLEMKAFSEGELQKIRARLQNVDLQDPVSEKQRLRKELEASRKAERQSVILKNLSEEIQKLNLEQEKVDPQLEELPKQIALNKSQAETLKERLEKLNFKKENENLLKALEDHRHKLQDGQPCPLCGALEHPYAQDLPPQEDGLQEEIRDTEKELAAKQTQVTQAETSLQHYQKLVAQLNQKTAEKQKELQAQKSDFEAAFGAFDSGFDWAARCNQHDGQIQALEQYEQENRKLRAISAGLPLIKKLQTVLTEGLELKEQLDGLYSGENVHNDCQDLQNKWNRLQHQKTTLAQMAKEQKARLSGKKQQLEELEKSLFPKVKSEGCNEISEALERLLPEQKAAELRKKKEELCSETTKTEVAIKTLSLELQKLQEKDVEEASEVLSGNLQQKLEQLQNLNTACEELRRKLNNHRDILQKIQKIEEGLVEKKQKIRRWELLNQLIGDATGKKFNDFAQDLSLSQLLQLANKRLRGLSDRYRIDKPSESEDDGLVAIDEHMGGQRRSVKTLSGGETFILSLSMALALSDLASKNVEINSLFIDEGFGTLDPETLDQTLDTLERLQAESSKTIGIISHVDSLKERIATQIQLKRNGQGYSSLELKG